MLLSAESAYMGVGEGEGVTIVLGPGGILVCCPRGAGGQAAEEKQDFFKSKFTKCIYREINSANTGFGYSLCWPDTTHQLRALDTGHRCPPATQSANATMLSKQQHISKIKITNTASAQLSVSFILDNRRLLTSFSSCWTWTHIKTIQLYKKIYSECTNSLLRPCNGCLGLAKTWWFCCHIVDDSVTRRTDDLWNT